MADDTFYMVDGEDGFQVRVPASKLEDWQKAQSEPSRPLTDAERAVADRIVASLYGGSAPSPSAAELAAQLEYERRKNAAEWEEFFREARMRDPISGQLILSKEDFEAYKKRRAAYIAQRDALAKCEAQIEYEDPGDEEFEDDLDTDYDSSYDSLPEAPARGPYVPQAQRRRLSAGSPVVITIVLFALVACFSIGFAVSSKPAEKASDPWASTYVSDHPTIYVGSVNSDLIHLSTCQYAKNISNSNKVYYENVDYALKDGRSRCSSCLSLPPKKE